MARGDGIDKILGVYMMVIAYRPSLNGSDHSETGIYFTHEKRATKKRYPSNHLEHKKRKDKPTQVKEKILANKNPVHIKGKILVNSKTHPYHAWHRNSGWC